MTAALRERTVLPPADPSGLTRFAQGLLGEQASHDLHPDEPSVSRACLLGPDGTLVEVPDEIYTVLLDVVAALSQGLAITIAPHNTMLTTQEAADLLNVSRPTLVRLLTEGEIDYTMRGRHRRVMLRDVLDYQERTRRERREALDEMVASGEEAGIYEATITPRRTR